MDNRTLELFQRKAIKSESELIQAIDKYLMCLNDESDETIPAAFYRPALIDLIGRLRAKIPNCGLTYLEKPYETYEITITNIDISLNVIEYEKLVFDKDGELESGESSEYPAILCVEASFIPIEEFAQRCSVDVETALGWIKARDIKCAKEEESGWHIIETQASPARIEESESGSYIFVGDKGDLGSVIPLQNNAVELHAIRSRESEDYFDVMLFDSDGFMERKQIDVSSFHEMEDSMIRSEEVVFVNTLVDTIGEKAVLGLDRNPFLDLKQEQLDNFFEQLMLPHETIKTLKAMAKNPCGEGLLLLTLRELSLEEKFRQFVDTSVSHHKNRQ